MRYNGSKLFLKEYFFFLKKKALKEESKMLLGQNSNFERFLLANMIRKRNFWHLNFELYFHVWKLKKFLVKMHGNENRNKYRKKFYPNVKTRLPVRWKGRRDPFLLLALLLDLGTYSLSLRSIVITNWESASLLPIIVWLFYVWFLSTETNWSVDYLLG